MHVPHNQTACDIEKWAQSDSQAKNDAEKAKLQFYKNSNMPPSNKLAVFQVNLLYLQDSGDASGISAPGASKRMTVDKPTPGRIGMMLGKREHLC